MASLLSSEKLCHKCDLFYAGDCPTHDLPTKRNCDWLHETAQSIIKRACTEETKITDEYLATVADNFTTACVKFGQFPSTAIARLAVNDYGVLPCVLQIIELKELDNNRTRVVLSDGNHYIQGLLNSVFTAKYVTPKHIGEYSMISLTDCIIKLVGGVQVLIVADMIWVGEPNIQIGDPLPIDKGHINKTEAKTTQAEVKKNAIPVTIVDQTPASGPIDLKYVLGLASKFTDEQWTELADNKKKEKEEITNKKKKGQWIGINIPGTKARMTITWLGHPSDSDTDKIERDYHDLKVDIASLLVDPGSPVFGVPTQIHFWDTWETFGKPEDIKAGKGIEVRRCSINTVNVYDLLLAFHRKWYHHEPGSDESRKTGIKFHVSVGKDITRDELAALTTVTIDETNIIWHR